MRLASPAGDGVERVRLLVAYDGAPFAGVAPNSGVRTVVGDLSAHLARRFAGHSSWRAAPVVAGRTDRGVHAWGQVMHVDLPRDAGSLRSLLSSLNATLGPDVVVRAVQRVDSSFDARFSATFRRYRYRVAVDPPPPWTARHVWWPGRPLDAEAMNATAAAVVGTHDFASFCRRPKEAPGRTARSLVRTVTEAVWTHAAPGAVEGGVGERGATTAGGSDAFEVLDFFITGLAFCHQMVRSIVGLCVAAGSGAHNPDDTGAVLAARNRNAVRLVAPPRGLTLMAVGYPDRFRWDSHDVEWFGRQAGRAIQ